jgi:hypothetical protein
MAATVEGDGDRGNRLVIAAEWWRHPQSGDRVAIQGAGPPSVCIYRPIVEKYTGRMWPDTARDVLRFFGYAPESEDE